ncbi:precorrin-3B synthase [Mumia flava]|uniref:Precorrin-3B synthase n=1 Tax=Mumia flava TaxID=1348852 RepID=A0A0B2BUV7_9ACTN|nr:hypothetical protein [Mumia flava]PJJ58051.1 precorrin-3B synthase [Mumia flava]
MDRTRVDRCPGVLRPWPADDGALVRLRLPGGRITPDQLRLVADLADAYGVGRLSLTSRANLQLRSVAVGPDGRPVEAFTAALERAHLLPSRAHDLVRNLACSPLTGRVGGAVDLRPVLAALDAALLADERLAGLPGKFLLALDDGSYDVAGDGVDLAAIATGGSGGGARLVAGEHDTGVVAWPDAVPALIDLAHAFLDAAGTGPSAPWHVRELPHPLRPRPRFVESGPDSPGGFAPQLDTSGTGQVWARAGVLAQRDGRYAHVIKAPEGVVTADAARTIAASAVAEVIVTPARTVVLPDLPTERPEIRL